MSISIAQPSICIVIVFVLLCHKSMNYLLVKSFGYIQGLYHSLVFCFAAKSIKVLINMQEDSAHVVRYTRRHYVKMTDMVHGLATLNSQ